MHLLDSASVIGLQILKYVTVTLASTMIIGSSYVAWDMYHAEKSAFASYDLTQYRPQVENGEPATLEEVEAINADSRAWLTVYGTHIDYPVTQGSDDLEYVNKDIYGNTTPTGSIYLTSQNSGDFSDSYNLMYGHHMDNGAMFGDVEKYVNKGYFDSHTKGILVTHNQVYDLELFGIVEDYAYNGTIYNPKRTGLGIVDYVRSNATHWRDAGNIEKVLGLSTCDYERTNGRDIAFFKVSPHEGDYQTYIPDPKPPLIGHEDNYWALLNLLCMIITVYGFLPVHVLMAKYQRKANLQDKARLINNNPAESKGKLSDWVRDNGLDGSNSEDDSVFDTKKNSRRITIGTIAEFAIAAAAVITFILTEDMRLPIRITDQWTPLMLVFVLAVWLVDIRLLRLETKANSEEH